MQNATKKPKSTRKSRAEQKKQLLYNTAIELINQNGYEKTSIEDIVKRANVAIGTFYLYFGSKKELLFYTVNMYDAIVQESYEEARKYSTFAEQIKSYFEHDYAKINGLGKEVIKALYGNSLQEEVPIVNNQERPMYMYVDRIVRHGLASGELSKEILAQEYTSRIIAVALGIDYYWCTYPYELDLETFARKQIEILVDALLVKEMVAAEELEEEF